MSELDTVSGTEEQPMEKRAHSRHGAWGLSGKLLLLTIPLVMIAGMLIYVPAIANFRMNRLNDRLAAANTAALVLEASPYGMVPDSLARQILSSIGAHAVAIKMGQQRRLLASADLPSSVDQDVDMRSMTAWSAIVGSFQTMLETHDQTIRVIGPAPSAGEFIETVVDEAPLRAAMLPLLAQPASGLLRDRGADRRAGLCCPAFPVRAPDAASDRESGRLPRESGKPGAHLHSQPARRRDRRCRARIVGHAT